VSLIQFLGSLLQGVVVTVQVTALASLLGLVVSLVAGLGRLSGNRVVRFLAGTFIEVFRGTSVLVQLFFIFYVLPLFGISLSPLAAAVLALGLNIGSYGAEVVRGAILAVPREQTEAAVALNMSPSLRIRRVVLPQAVVAMLPPFNNLAIQLLKGTSLVSLISLSDLTFEAQILRSNTGETLTIFTMVAVLYFVMAYTITLGFRFLEGRVAKGMDIGRQKKMAA